MLSDESSSDSETGRFKGSENKEERKPSSDVRDDRASRRTRPSENDRIRREFDRKRDDRDRHDRRERSRERPKISRDSPASRRKYSRDRSPRRRSRDRYRPRRSPVERPKPNRRSASRERKTHSQSKSRKSPDHRRDLKDEIKRNTTPKRSTEKKSVERHSSSPDYIGKRSVVHRPAPVDRSKAKSESPIVVEEHAPSDGEEEVQPAGSYYSMIPPVIKDKSEESSEIDSSDDERLRAKLLNLEKELQKTRKKKHKKKHKRKTSKSKEREASASVEVTSTTDIQHKVDLDAPNSQPETAEVTSTQKSNAKESSEEGEILSDDSQAGDIDPSDLRHKLKRSAPKTDRESPDLRERLKSIDVCGPALPPHLEKRYKESESPSVEGPALPPHLKQKDTRNIGPAIPEDMRKVLAEKEPELVKDESSDEDTGFGPLPAGAEGKWSEAHQRLEERALDMKIRQMEGHSLQDSKVKSREQWMLELPEGKTKYLGLEARSFRAKEGPDMSDRSSWTDTPEQKARKAAGEVRPEQRDAELQRDTAARLTAARDDQQEQAVRKHKKKHKRDESLLEMHQKKLKKKKKKDDKDDEKKERRPFSRDVDLQVNRFDEAQKRSIIKKAQALDSRFSRGDAKYL